jgi:4'-phosphopantetheinyl transferase
VKKIRQQIGPDSFSPRRLPLRQIEKPCGDVVHLWHLDFDALSNPLNPDSGSRANNMSMAQQRAVRRFYLRLLLGAYLNLPGKDVHIKRRVKGRPELDSIHTKGELNFSVARSEGSYLIGISGGADIGVDLEVASRRAGKPMGLARRYFSEDETLALSNYTGIELHAAFVHTWACKEAVVKASGVGIANQLCRFSVDVNPEKPPAIKHMMDDDEGAWCLAMASPVDDEIAAVAVRNKKIRLECFSLS